MNSYKTVGRTILTIHWEHQCVVLWYGKGLMQSCLIPLSITVCDTTIKYVTFSSHVRNKNGGSGSKISPALRCQKLLTASLQAAVFYLGLNLGYKKQWIQKRIYYSSIAAKICSWKTLEWVTLRWGIVAMLQTKVPNIQLYL